MDEEPPSTGTAGPLAPGLYLVSTPIGNARDITLRALDVLASADVLAAEDTRNTRRLLTIHGVRRPPGGQLLPYHDHNGAAQRPRLLAALAEGRSVALVSDAGTPLVADPGYRLAAEAIAAGHPVVAVPGASAALAALAVAGLPTDRFLFAGFLPPRRSARRTALSELAAVPATLILLREPAPARRRASPTWRRCSGRTARRRSAASSPSVSRRPGATVSRRWPQRRRTAIRRGARWWCSSARRSRARRRPANSTPPWRAALTNQSVSDAADEVATELGLPRRQVYARALALGRGA